jgi:F0F1-type ATP synthase assembly protein I
MERETSPGARNESARANEVLQSNLQQSGSRILASYALVGAIILFGGAGYAVDRWARTSPWFLILGLLVGVFFGFYRLFSSMAVKSD